jgi:hypothetical protein
MIAIIIYLAHVKSAPLFIIKSICSLPATHIIYDATPISFILYDPNIYSRYAKSTTQSQHVELLAYRKSLMPHYLDCDSHSVLFQYFHYVDFWRVVSWNQLMRTS